MGRCTLYRVFQGARLPEQHAGRDIAPRNCLMAMIGERIVPVASPVSRKSRDSRHLV